MRHQACASVPAAATVLLPFTPDPSRGGERRGLLWNLEDVERAKKRPGR
jgi:hypothetical protein